MTVAGPRLSSGSQRNGGSVLDAADQAVGSNLRSVYSVYDVASAGPMRDESQ
jgi:hypothetical protein